MIDYKTKELWLQCTQQRYTPSNGLVITTLLVGRWKTKNYKLNYLSSYDLMD